MPNYTPEQVEQSCERASEIEYEANERDKIVGGDMHHMVVLYNALITIREEQTSLRAVLKAAQKDNADWQEYNAELLHRAEAAEKERDHWRQERDHEYKYGEEMQFGMEAEYDRAEALFSKLEALTAYVSKLEKAGDGMFGCSAANFDKACDSWHTTRKAKP